MKVIIRPSKDDEFGKIIDLQTQSLIASHSQRYTKRQLHSLIKGQKGARRRHEVTFVAESQNAGLLGFACILAFDNHISGIYVHPDYFHQGIGTLLLKELEASALKEKRRTVYVNSSLEAEGFYLKNGYALIKRTGFFTQDRIWIPCQLLRKELIPLTRAEKIRGSAIKIITGSILLGLIITILF